MRAKKIGQPHLGDYIKGSGIAHHTQLHKTFTQKNKRAEKERQQKKAKYTSIKQRKAILALRDSSEISRGEGGGNFKFGFGNEVTHPRNGSEIF